MISLDLPDPLKQQATLSSNPDLIKESIVLQSTANEDVKSHGSIFFSAQVGFPRKYGLVRTDWNGLRNNPRHFFWHCLTPESIPFKSVRARNYHGMKAPILWKTKVKRVKVISNGNLPLWKGLVVTHIPSSCGFMSEVIPPQSNLKICLKSVSRAVGTMC